MGRTSAGINNQRQAKVIADERSEAIGAMNGKLKRKFRRIEKMFTDTREANLKFYYALGRELIEARDNPEDYERNALGKLDRALATQKRTMRKARQFAELYTAPQLEVLLQLVHVETGFRIHWGHLSYLLGLNTERQRAEWAVRAVRYLWDPPALHAAIKRRFPDRGVGGGRPHKLPATTHLQIRQMMEVARNFVNKRRLWNSDDENVFANILNEAPDQLEEIDLENLEAAKEYINRIATEVLEMSIQLDACISRVKNVFEVRDENVVKEAEQEAVAGKQHRVIDLDTSKKGTARSRRGAATAV